MTSSWPRVSLVIASGAGGDFLPQLLDSLRDQVARQQAEVLIPDRCGGAVVERLRRDYPWATVIEAPADPHPGIPQLRQLGAQQATGDVVAVIEEHCRAPAGWLDAIVSSFQKEDAAIGGPILDDDYPAIRDWVVYFSEYHNYIPPWPEGDRYLLNGANIAYRRDLLEKHDAVLGTGYWEVVLHPLLAKDGRMRAVPGVGAHHCGPFPFGYYLEQRYLLSRVWGGTQRDKVSPLKRLIYLVAAPVFPLLLLSRIAHRVFSQGHRVGKFLQALPLLVPVTCTYVWGEWRGYLSGVGDALERVE